MQHSSLQIVRIAQKDLAPLLSRITDIRMAVFSSWPYLYDGNLDDEHKYLQHFTHDPESLVVGAFDSEALVGISTASRWETHPENLLSYLPGDWRAVPVTDILYLAESVLYEAYRGFGAGRAFFREREAFAREIGRRYVAFAAVVRDPNDPRRPIGYRDLVPWWRRLGYAPIPNALCEMEWKDHGRDKAHTHHLQVWMKEL